MMINLSPKAMRAIVESLEFRIAAHRDRLDTEVMSEDDISDLTNDLMFLESLMQELQQALALPVAQVF